MSDHNTQEEFAAVKAVCRDIFEKKLKDYGTSWRIMRPSSLTDQIFIKARRIRSLEEKGIEAAAVNEGIEPEFIGIVNYCAIALIQLDLGAGDTLDTEEALRLYNEKIDAATALMLNKNHDYDEAWREMRVSSFTDIILETNAHQGDRGPSRENDHKRGNRCKLHGYDKLCFIRTYQN